MEAWARLLSCSFVRTGFVMTTHVGWENPRAVSRAPGWGGKDLAVKIASVSSLFLFVVSYLNYFIQKT